MTRPRGAGWFVVALPYAWLALFFLLPFAILTKISLSEPANASPPYLPLFDEAGFHGTPENFALLFSDRIYVGAMLESIRIAATCTAICLLIGYPMAYAIAHSRRSWRAPLLVLVMLPFWTSFVVRTYAWMGLLRPTGIVNAALAWLGIAPMQLMANDFAVHLGIVYGYLPFMVLPLYAAIERLDRTLLEAAADLGASPRRAFLTVTMPLTVPGILAGCLLVFVPAVGEFVVPDLLGGPDTLMIGKLVWTEFFQSRDWPVAAALAIILVMIVLVPVVVFQRRQARLA
jgi:putrescine transport system permease protein